MASCSVGAVQPGRIRILKQSAAQQPGPVIYWMFRDQRVQDNWALIHAVDEANKLNVPLAVAFNLFDQFLGAKARQLGFMLRSLQNLHHNLRNSNIPFFLFQGEAVDTIPNFLEECGASLLVMDFSPLREVRSWKETICEKVSDTVSIHEVDAHNVVPLWVSSNKLEYSARTIRSKINKLLPEYLIDFPTFGPVNKKWDRPTRVVIWENLIAEVVRKGAEVPELEWCIPGEVEATEVLAGLEKGFLTKRLKNYTTERNNPLKPKSLSCLSPYLHFGQISAQRCALEACKVRSLAPQLVNFPEGQYDILGTKCYAHDALDIKLTRYPASLKSVDAFLEELIVRRELADNFCYYQPQYDSIHGAWEWARKTLMDHVSDKREHVYTKDQLEKAQTADHLWNASQLEMVHHGKMHGFMRMYWAKKILEWTSRPEEALAIAIYLNDKYHIDGRDPNGYVGCMWSICGVHDQGWKERPVFGKIRYMNYAGCKRKFDVDGYIAYVKKLVGENKKRKAESLLPNKAKELRA